MRPRDVDYTPALRRLSLFAACTCCKKCKGFKPKIGGVTDEFIQQKGLFFGQIDCLQFDVSDLEEFPLFEPCRDCNDSMKDHMDSMLKKKPAEIEYFGDMAKDAATLHKWLGENDDRDKLTAVLQLYQIMMKSLATCSFSHLPDYGESVEKANAVMHLTNYVSNLKEEAEETQNLVSLASHLLSEFAGWAIPTPKEFAKAVPTYDHGFFKLFYVRWLTLVEFPRKLKSMNQHEAPEAFGVRPLHAFLSHYLANVPKHSEKEYVTFAKNVHAYCESRMKSNSKQKSTLPANIEPIRFTRSSERHDAKQMTAKGKKRLREVEEVEPIKNKLMLQCVVRIVEQEREAAENIDADKMAIDVAKSECVRRELEAGVSEFRIVSCHSHPYQEKQEMAWLIQLKTLFCVQLPKMGSEYITRLVFDQNHKNLALIKNCKVIGGICFRPFYAQGFMEIVFLAVTGSDQIKGYGTILMNTLKDYAVKQGCLNMMTYADAFALGYFGKQGFCEKFDIPKKTYQGFIKDYEGATLMACQLHPMVRYGEFYQYIKNVRDLHQALSSFRNLGTARKFGGIEHVFRKHHHKVLKLKHIPGLEMFPDNIPMERDDELDYKMRHILKKLRENECSWPFLHPVDAHDVPEYYEFIKYPMDLQTIGERVKSKYYVHQRLFLADLYRMFNNCYRFNGSDTEYYRCGYVLNGLAFKLVSQQFPDADVLPHLPDLKPQVSRY